MDIIIRQAFQTDELELENLQSDGHKIYDQRVKQLCRLFGLKSETPDSLTNISTNVVMGVGDCRHHAQVKQILFDCWQSNQISQQIVGAYTSPQLAVTFVDDTRDVLSQKMVTMDVELSAPIQMRAPYDAEKDDNGNYLPATDGQAQQKVEEHTMNVLLERDHQNQIQHVTLKDALYQNEYEFAHLPLDDSSTDSSVAMPG